MDVQHRFWRKWPGAIALAVFLLPAYSFPCHADRVEQGRLLAERLCATCHMNKGQGEKSGPMGVPSFQAVADRRAQNHARIVKWLRSGPVVMPDHKLTWDEVDALAAFILSLRKNR
ncbi:MAG: c-type cytochrome [Hyphomicrobiaceae bacterium]